MEFSRRPPCAALLVAAACMLLNAPTARGQLRILDYNVAASGSASSGPRPGMDTVLRAIGDQNGPGFSAPISIMLLQEGASAATTGQAYADLLNTITSGTSYRAAAVDGATTGGGRPLAVYNSAAVTLISEQALGVVGTTSQPRQTMRYRFRPVGYDSTADFYVYNSHLKSSNDSTSARRRDVEMVVNRGDADALGDGVNIIYAGDWNLYTGTEAAFRTMLAAGNGQAFDPLDAVGSWSGNAAFKAVHTQSPATAAAYGGQVTGGLNDRFDFQLVTHEWLDGGGLDYIPGSYRAFGNTNSHVLSGAVTTGSAAALQTLLPGYTLAQSGTILTNLARVSDHLPVVADYQLPARMAASLVPPPPAVIQGAVASATLTVANSAPVAVVRGADRLDYGYTAAGVLTGAGSGSDQALGGDGRHTLTVDTSSVGLRSGTVTVLATSLQTASPSFVQTVTTSVLDHARGSFSAAGLTSLDVDFGTLMQGTGPIERTFGVFNLAGSFGAAWTANLDLDRIAAAAPASVFSTTLAPFTNLPPGSSRAFGLSMQTTTTGSFSGSYVLSLSDQDLPGAAAQTLALTVRGAVVSPALAVLNVPGGMQTQAELGFAAITGTAAVIKTGLGTIVANDLNTFTGGTRVEQGILAIGSAAGVAGSPLVEIAGGAGFDVSGVSGGYVVPAGQTVGGGGTVIGSVTFGRGSTLSPGDTRLPAQASAASPPVAAVPEPGSPGWVVVGVAALLARRRPRRPRATAPPHLGYPPGISRRPAVRQWRQPAGASRSFQESSG